jgi:ATP/maltotriose-dependent transcriptional regulator MalT
MDSTTTTNRLPSQAGTEEEAEERASGRSVPSLSGREREVLGHVVAGRTNRQIAQELHFSLSTVKRHLERINHKLGVSDRTQAVVKAIELGLLPARKER